MFIYSFFLFVFVIQAIIAVIAAFVNPVRECPILVYTIREFI